MEKYSPSEIEKKWQQKWEEEEVYKTEMDPERPKYYALEMFPYPSGNLHMGHVRNYSIGDVMARYKTMEGFNVLHPMGFDSFGMPAENAAIKHGVRPGDWTYSNIDNMIRQQKGMGLSYDWDRKAITCSPDYYKWTQWLFELFYKRGLAYKKEASVNWCDTCGTVLANEQVIDGKCWRCDSEVHKKDLSQWFFKITDYADRLLADLEKLPGWPERVKTMQANWIGRSEGLEFNIDVPQLGEKLSVYTTRPDTAYGITFVALAAEHPIIGKILKHTNYSESINIIVINKCHLFTCCLYGAEICCGYSRRNDKTILLLIAPFNLAVKHFRRESAHCLVVAWGDRKGIVRCDSFFFKMAGVGTLV